MRSHLRHVPKDISRNRGFSLIELMVAMAIFVLVSASVFMLFSHQQTNANQQQGLVGLNIGIRNVISQLQLDLANAGTGYYVGPNIPTWPIGVTILNNVQSAGTSCYNATTNTYTTDCFDQLNILTAANSTSPTPPINATDQTGGTSGTSNCSKTSAGVAYGQAAVGLTLAATAGNYSQGDQLLLLHNSSKGSYMTAVKLTQAPVPVGLAVKFTFNPTNSDGTNTGPNWQTNDPLDISACENNQNTGSCPTPNNFGNQFCGGDWILKVFPISYYVDTSNSNDPQLIRQQGGNKVAVMDQVIGFKLGAAIWNSINNGTWGTSYYFYDASTYNLNNPTNPTTGVAYSPDSPYLFSLIRSVRVSLIARTQPSTDPSFTFRNAFDNGPYIVQGASVVVNPRNLSMNE
jgi:prepilin-type N-terminal cleavage/methylation domain-containing protein